jgi:hypothetical protein
MKACLLSKGFHEESLLWRGLSPNETILMAVNQDFSQYGSGNYDASFTVGSTGSRQIIADSTSLAIVLEIIRLNHASQCVQKFFRVLDVVLSRIPDLPSRFAGSKIFRNAREHENRKFESG